MRERTKELKGNFPLGAEYRGSGKTAILNNKALKIMVIHSIVVEEKNIAIIQ